MKILLFWKRKKKMSIPVVPDGVRNPNDLYNGWYGDVGPLRWDNPEFHDRLKWLSEQVPFTPSAVQYAALLAEGPDTRFTPTIAHIDLGDGISADIDARYIMLATEACYATLFQIRNGGVAPQVKPYPGYKVRNPDTSVPVGEAWPNHPWKGRRMFRAAEGDTLPVGATWEDERGRFEKRQFVVVPGSGPFGTGAKFAFAWEQVYVR